MKCISPVYLEKGAVSCGKCVNCLSRLRNEWTFRLEQELLHSDSCYFMTLTYADENLRFVTDDGVCVDKPTLSKRDFQLFMKKLRHDEERLRYYAVGEYGSETNRPHYHLLLFNFSQPGLLKVHRTWQLGGVMVDAVNDARLHYMTKYHMNKHSVIVKEDDRQPPFRIDESTAGYWIRLSKQTGIALSCLWRAAGFRRPSRLSHETDALLSGSDFQRRSEIDSEGGYGWSAIGSIRRYVDQVNAGNGPLVRLVCGVYCKCSPAECRIKKTKN